MFRILLADDEGIMLESLKKIITTSFGSECDIRCVKTGRGVVEMAESFHPDMIEIMPGVMPKIIKSLRGSTSIPLIAGGLIADKEDVMGALLAGASAVSTSRQDVWEM